MKTYPILLTLILFYQFWNISIICAQNANSGIGLPGNLNPDGTLHLYSSGMNGGGARLILGDDISSFSGVRVYIGEFGWQNSTPSDSDILELHGSKGFKFTIGYDPNNLTIPFEITDNGFIRLHVMDTLLTSAYNVVIQDDGTLAVQPPINIHPPYQIGSLAMGGIIFWVDARGEHGLAINTVDLTTGIEWSSDTNAITGATGGDGIGAGMMNTLMIISSNREGPSAAKLCSNFSIGGFGDWYLPAQSELDLVHQNRDAVNTTSMALGLDTLSIFYWTSTEKDSTGAVVQDVLYGFKPTYNKKSKFRVRAIRMF